jgi:hypothetical protein
MLFSSTARRRPSLSSSLRQQLLRARVGDDQPPFRVGEQNRVGDRIDDGVEQRALAPQPSHFLRQRSAAADLFHLLAEHADSHANVGP